MATSNDYEARDEDRLPWLETVDDDYDDGPSLARIILMVLLGLAVIAAAIFGYYWYQKHRGVDGNGELINAQEGDYKVKPDDAGGMNVTGEGDTAVATSDGQGGANGKIDLNTAPEAPVNGKKAAATPAPSGGGKTAVAALPTTSGTLKAGSAVVQLGSFPSEVAANTAWGSVSKKFGYLAGLGKSVQQANVGGHTVYRLRVNTGSTGQAQDICGKLKAGGQACFVTSN